MVTKSLLLLGCSFMLGAVAGFATSAIIHVRLAVRVRTAYARELRAIARRHTEAVESGPAKIRITEVPRVIDFGALVQRFRIRNADAESTLDEASPLPEFGPSLVNKARGPQLGVM